MELSSRYPRSLLRYTNTGYQYRRKKDEQFTALQSGINIDEEKEKLTRELAEQYSRNIITVEEYEHLLEYINKIETKKSSNRIEKIIGKHGNGNDEIKIHKISEKHPEKGNDFGKKMRLFQNFSFETATLKICSFARLKA